MNTADQIAREISLGEDSGRQFKVKLNAAVQIAKEMCAMSNGRGGKVFIGVADDGSVAGVSVAEIQTYNQWISAAANEMIRPAIYPQTQNVVIDGKTIMCIEVPEGMSKPYCDKDGIFWIKSGSDTNKVSPQELVRLFQQSGQLNLDETLSSQSVLVMQEDGKEEWNIDRAKFFTFFERNFGKQVSEAGLPLEKILENMNLARDGKLTIAGLLLFGANVQGAKPFCIVRAVAYPGTDISDNTFNDKRDCVGTLEEQYRTAITFLKNNLARVQDEETFNTQGKLEIDEKALEEVIVNALLHRDYSKQSPIRLLIFKDRVEVISPGSLPNHLTVENIKNGNSVMRNPLVSSYGTKILPYSGIGSGVPRILRAHASTTFVDDKDGQQFKVVMMRTKQ